jgi:chemotaxis protein CheX
LIALSFSEKLYLQLAGRLLDEEFSAFTPDVADVGAECCNIILGASKQGLSDLGIALGLTTPSTISGKNHSVNFSRHALTVETIASCDLGDFYFLISFEASLFTQDE